MPNERPMARTGVQGLRELVHSFEARTRLSAKFALIV
jgi:hypothetical protein